MTRTVLIVDDNAINRQILCMMLDTEYSVAQARNGLEALELLARERQSVSAVLLDILMPVMDGFEVLERMRSDAALAQIPVIVTTGSTEPETEKKALALGANDVIHKPFDPDILKRRLFNLISLRETSANLNAYQKDRLTGLWSRESFFERAAEAIAGEPAGTFILSCLDVNAFKVINDQYGNEKGDEVLKAIAKLVSRDCEADGSLCGRISADRFVVLFRADILDRIPEARARHDFDLTGEFFFPVNISIGRYLVTDKSLPVSAMYDRAMLALATIKGRSDTYLATYDESMRSRIIREREIINEMRGALVEGQFEAWYQPQYNHSTGALIGAEALVRWRHPEHGLVPPGVFIPIFEQNGFIYELDRYVWEDVCRHLRKWRDEGLDPLPVSVNISRYDMLHPELESVITGLLAKYALPVELLRLEVTESAFSSDTAGITAVVKRLISAGFTVEIDDFGSGYSSLNTLKDVPAQILKLDMRFFEQSADSERSGNIIESVVRMAKWLGMSVIAEGVERRAQADFLRSIGCSYIQGYLYAKPMPAEEYAAHCAQQETEERLIALETVENLDNNAFWNPESMDTLIFNGYVGAACIFEFYNGHIDLLRATELYARLFGSSVTVEAVLKLDLAKHFDENNAAALTSVLKKSFESKLPVTAEFTFLGLPGCPNNTCLRSTLRVIARVGDRQLVYCTSENITEQREAERQAHESAEQMKTLMNDTPGSFARMRLLPDGRLSTVFVNDTLCELRQMTREEILGADTTDASIVIHPDDRETALNAIRYMLRTGDKAQVTYRLLRADGTYIPMKVHGRVTKDNDGSLYVNIYYTELSAQEQFDYSLGDATPFILSAIMRSSPNLDYAKDTEFRYICCSPALVRFLGKTNESEVLGKTDFELFSRDVAERFRGDDIRLFENGESLIEYTEQIPSSDGIPRYSLTSKYILRDSTGKIIGLYGTARDVTDIRTDSDRLRLLTDSLPGGIARFALTPHSCELVYYNDGMCKMLDCTREEYDELQKKGVAARVFPEDMPELQRQIDEMYANGTPIDCTYRNSRANGHGYVWINMRGELSERNGETCFVNAVLYDVTSKHNTIERQKQLLDNLPCGTAVYEYDGQTLSAVYLNRQYLELLGCQENDCAPPSFLSVVHPDDLAVISDTIDAMLREHRDMGCDIRVRYGENGCRRFHIAGRMVLQKNGKYRIFATYSPLS